MSKYRKERKNNSSIKWTIAVLILTFFLSLFFSYIATEPISNLNLIPASIILIAVILIGIFFDIIAVAVTVAGEDNFHAKATKKIKGAKTSIKLIRNSSRVSNFCADVIGDICGVLSGSIGALISVKIMSFYEIDFNIQFLVGAVIASITVGGKAIGKNIAMNNSEAIVDMVSKILSIFKRRKKTNKNKEKADEKDDSN